MKAFSPVLIATLLLVIPFHPHAQTDSVLPRVEIAGTQRLSLTSNNLAQEYELHINLPRNYQADTGRRFPVVYLLDGQYDFPFLTGVYGGQYFDGFLPELIIVGISWGGKNPDAGALRARDFTPTHISQMPQSGGGPAFLDFIKKELVPFISRTYRVSDDRTLMGSSLGGLFTLYALYNEPSLFRRYVLTSPSLPWDNFVLRRFETKFEAQGLLTPVRLFMGIGELEGDLSPFHQLVERLQKVKGLELQTTVIKNTGHAGSKPEGFARGLQYVFQRPSVKLAPAVLKRYTGVYQLGTDTLQVAIENGQLVGIAPDKSRVKLQAATEKDFYVNGMFLQLHFKNDDTGRVNGFQLVQFDGDVFVKKIR